MIISSSISYISGQDVVIVKSGRRICGTGAALGNAPIVQNKAYFEVKIQSTGNCLLPTAREGYVFTGVCLSRLVYDVTSCLIPLTAADRCFY